MSKYKILYCRRCERLTRCYFVEMDGDYDYRCGQCRSYAVEYRRIHTKHIAKGFI